MTKTVRVENADTGTFKVVVEVRQGSSNKHDSFIVSSKTILNHPTALREFMIHSGQYLVVREPYDNEYDEYGKEINNG